MSLNSRSAQPPWRVLAFADDLSGAAETAACLRLPARIALDPAMAQPPAPGAATVLDLDTRGLSPDAAARVVRDVLRGRPVRDDTLLFKKTDSLLRGNLAAEAVAYAEGAAGVVFAPALPVNGRTVRDGVVHLDGTPLHGTDAWRAESRPAPRSVADALDGLPVTVVPLDAVRAPGLTCRLRSVLDEGRHPVCDAETDADLDAVADAALGLGLGPGVRMLGTGGLASALGRQLGGVDAGAGADAGVGAGSGGGARVGAGSGAGGCAGPGDGPRAPVPEPVRRPLLVVVGTAEPAAAAQIAQLTAHGAAHTALPAHELAHVGSAPHAGNTPHAGNASRLAVDLARNTSHRDATLHLTVDPHGITVVSIDASRGLHPERARLADGLARTVAALPHTVDLVLTGGETARRVLDALRIGELTPLRQIHHGAVHSRTADGRHIVTRPGSYGDTDSLLRIARALRPHPTPPPQHRQPASDNSPVPQGESL